MFFLFFYGWFSKLSSLLRSPTGLVCVCRVEGLRGTGKATSHQLQVYWRLLSPESQHDQHKLLRPTPCKGDIRSLNLVKQG